MEHELAAILGVITPPPVFVMAASFLRSIPGLHVSNIDEAYLVWYLFLLFPKTFLLDFVPLGGAEHSGPTSRPPGGIRVVKPCRFIKKLKNLNSIFSILWPILAARKEIPDLLFGIIASTMRNDVSMNDASMSDVPMSDVPIPLS